MFPGNGSCNVCSLGGGGGVVVVGLYFFSQTFFIVYKIFQLEFKMQGLFPVRGPNLVYKHA